METRRLFIKKSLAASVALGAVHTLFASAQPLAPDNNETLHIAVFDVDATPPLGTDLSGVAMTGSWDAGLRAKGVVITGAGKPIVLCAIDWCGIANEAYDVFKQTLADAAKTTPDRVTVNTLHQHDAPLVDFSTEKKLNERGITPNTFDGSFVREFLLRLSQAVKESMNKTKPVTHIGTGKAPVLQVASNRRIVENGKVVRWRASSCGEASWRAEPEGLIDPDVTLVSFWNEDKPLAVLTFYACHPHSYYRTGIANPDFPGIARFMRQLAVPDALHIHFDGAGGNIAAGKYNDGSHINRLLLAQRLADGMEKAWNSVEKQPVTAKEVSWTTTPVLLPPDMNIIKELEKDIKDDYQTIKICWAERRQAGMAIDIACLAIGKARILFLPGELFVEYQLAAKAMRPDLDVSMAAYGDLGPAYIGTAKAYGEGGYEIKEPSPVTAGSEKILMDAIGTLLRNCQ